MDELFCLLAIELSSSSKVANRQSLLHILTQCTALPNPRSTHPSTAHHGTLHPPAVPLGSHLPNHGPPRQWTPRHQVRVRRRSHCRIPRRCEGHGCRRSSLEIRTRKRLGSCCRRSHLSCCHHHRQCVFPCCRSLDCCQRRVCDCSSDCPAIGCYEQQLWLVDSIILFWFRYEICLEEK